MIYKVKFITLNIFVFCQDYQLFISKTITVPVIVGTLCMIKKGTDKHINKISGCLSLYVLQTIALCGTAHLHRKVLSM